MPNAYDELLAGGASEYDAQITAEQDQKRIALRSTMFAAQKQNPDQYAKARQLERTTGVPAPITARNLPEVEQRANLTAYDDLLTSSPALATALTQSDFASLAHDDIDNLRAASGTINGPAFRREGVARSNVATSVGVGSTIRGIGSSFVTGAQRVREGLRMQFADAAGFEGMSADASRRYSQAALEEAGTTPNFESSTARGAYSGGTSLVRMTPALAASVLLRSPAPMMAAAGVQAEADAYGKYRARGASGGMAFLGAAGEGATEVATEMLPMRFLVNTFGRTGAGEFLTGMLAREIPSEQVATFVQDAIDTAVANPDKTWGQFFKERPEAAYETLIATVVQGGAMTALSSAARRVTGAGVQATDADQDAQAILALGELAKTSKVRTRDPESFARFIDSAAEDGPVQDVYLDARTLQATLNQSGIDPATLPASITEQLIEAGEAGRDVRIPVGDYAASLAASPASETLLQHLRTSPDAMSLADAQQFMQGQSDEFKVQAEKLVADAMYTNERATSAANVERELMAQLQGAGRFNNDVNGAYAKLMSAFYNVQSARLGITPEQMYVQYPLQVKADALPGRRKSLNQSGAFGPLFEQFRGKPDEAIAHLREQQTGEALGALTHPEIGDIDLVWGKAGENKSDGYGLAKLFKWHPEVADNLQEILAAMTVVSVNDNRVQLESADHKGAIRLAWDGESKNWLLTTFEKKKGGTGTSSDTAENIDGEGDTARPSAADLSIADDLSKYYQNARGMISFGDDLKTDPTVITLLQNADLSTFLHESGHFYLEVLNDIANQPNAPAEVVADFDKLLNWFGVPDRATWNGYDLEQKRPHHEQLARGFESYLFEGKAPNTELNGLFSRFRAWMVNVYRSLSALNVNLSEEVRGVFDRMVATNEEIMAAEAVRAYAPLFDSAESAGMTAAEWVAYQELGQEATQDAVDQMQRRSLRDMQWLSNAKGRALKALQNDAKAKRQEIETEVRLEVEAEPINQARAFLSKGMLPEADRTNAQRRVAEQASMIGTKMNRGAVKEMYGDSPAALWRYVPNNMLSEDGLMPDQIAELFGFESGDALIRELVGGDKPASKIEGLTDQRMLERYGDLVNPSAIDEAANAAIHNEARLKFIATGYKAASQSLGPVRVIVAAAKQAASRIIGAKVIKSLKPHQYEGAEARAGKAALKAAKDPAALATHTRDQMLNNALAKEAYAAQREVEKAVALFRRVVTGKNEDVVKTRDIDIVNAARAILADYGFGVKAKSAAEYLKSVEAYDPAMFGVLRDRVDAATASAKPFELLTVDEMRTLKEEIASLWHLAKRSRQMEVDGDLLDRETVQDALRERIEEIGIPDKVPGENRAVTDAERRLGMLQTARAALRRVESWVGAKDGDQTIGPFRKFIWQPIKEAADQYRTDKAKYVKAYRDLLDNIAPTLKPARIAAPELNYTFGFSKGGSGKAEILHALLHTGNESNMRKLLLGRRWATENVDGSLDTTDWDAFTARLINEGTLTKSDFDFVQGVWDLLEAMKPLAQKTHRDVFGHYFAEVTADSFETPFGMYRGGYVPALADAEVVTDAKTRALAEEENQSLAYAFPSTSKGFTKGRVEYNRPLLLDLRALSQHIDKVLLFSHLEQPIRDVRRVLTSNAVAYGLNRIDPAAFDGLLTPWLNRTSRQQVETPVAGSNGLMRFFSAARANAGMAAMFANVINTAQQVTGFSIAAVKVRPKYLLAAIADFTHGPREMARAVSDASPYMATRMDNEVAQMTSAINDILINPNVYQRAVNWSRKHAYFMQSAFDNVMGPIIWTGAYNEAIENGATDKDAKRVADSVVRETQGSTLPEDVSRIETGNAFVRMFTQFAGYFNMQANLLGTEFAKTSQSIGLQKGAGRGLYVLLFGFLVPAWGAELIVQAFRGGPGDEDKDGEYLDDWLLAVFGMSTVRGATAMVPGVGQGLNAMFNSFNDKPYDDRISTAPAISMIESAVKAPKTVYDAIVNDDKKPSRPIRDVATLISMTTGVPVNALARPAGYLADVFSDRVEPAGPVDLARGVVSGAASPDSKR